MRAAAPAFALVATVLAATVAAAPAQCLDGLAAAPAADGGIHLQWPDAGVPGTTGYQVLLRPVGGQWYPVQPQLPATALSWTDGGAAQGTNYEYAVVAMAGDTQAATYCSATATATATATPQEDAERSRPALAAENSAWMAAAGVLGLAALTVLVVARRR